MRFKSDKNNRRELNILMDRLKLFSSCENFITVFLLINLSRSLLSEVKTNFEQMNTEYFSKQPEVWKGYNYGKVISLKFSLAVEDTEPESSQAQGE